MHESYPTRPPVPQLDLTRFTFAKFYRAHSLLRSTPDTSVFLGLENGLHFPILKIFLFRESIYSEMEQHETKSIYRRAEFRILWFTSGDIIGETTLGIDARSTSTIVLIHPAEIGNIWTIVEPLFLSSIVITIQRGDKKQRLFVNNHESRI